MPIILALLVIGAAFLTDGRFLRADNLVNVVRQVSFEGTIAFGMTAIIITGGIDLSVGSLVALTGVVAAVVMQAAGGLPPAVAIALGALAAMAVGAGVGGASG
ncbi:MAG: ABC transporter permease, partial [Phycisphaerales bacterium]